MMRTRTACRELMVIQKRLLANTSRQFKAHYSTKQVALWLLAIALSYLIGEALVGWLHR